MRIARSCAISQSTVHRYLQKAAAAGLTWPIAEDIHDRRLEELLFRKPAGRPRPSRNNSSLPDFGEVHRQLQMHGRCNSTIIEP
jgi:transposase